MLTYQGMDFLICFAGIRFPVDSEIVFVKESHGKLYS